MNEYGCQLVKTFCTKAGVYEDIKNNKFNGMIYYEEHITDIQDAIGWMLETYDIEAINVIDEWMEDSHNAWGFPLTDLKNELKKCIDDN